MRKEILVWACPYCERVTNDPLGPCIRCGTDIITTKAEIELPELSSSQKLNAQFTMEQRKPMAKPVS